MLCKASVDRAGGSPEGSAMLINTASSTGGFPLTLAVIQGYSAVVAHLLSMGGVPTFPNVLWAGLPSSLATRVRVHGGGVGTADCSVYDGKGARRRAALRAESEASTREELWACVV